MVLYLPKNIKYQSRNAQNRRSGEMDSHIFETYKNYVMPHDFNIHQTAYEMAMDTMWAYPLYQHTSAHCKYMLRCCLKCPRIDITSQE